MPVLFPVSCSAAFASAHEVGQSGYARAAFADADVHDDAVAFTQ